MEWIRVEHKKSHQICMRQTGKNNSRVQEPKTEITQNHRCYLVQQNLQGKHAATTV